MVLFLINSVILLAGIGIPLGMIFWKYFAKRPKESLRAIITTVVGTLGLAIFFLQVFAMSTLAGQTIITLIQLWLN
jgi:hypothetical protein